MRINKQRKGFASTRRPVNAREPKQSFTTVNAFVKGLRGFQWDIEIDGFDLEDRLNAEYNLTRAFKREEGRWIELDRIGSDRSR